MKAVGELQICFDGLSCRSRQNTIVVLFCGKTKVHFNFITIGHNNLLDNGCDDLPFLIKCRDIEDIGPSPDFIDFPLMFLLTLLFLAQFL